MILKALALSGMIALLVAPKASYGSERDVPEPCLEAAAAQGQWAIEVAGGVKKTPVGSIYSLSVNFQPAWTEGIAADRLEVWAEPSHTALFVGTRSLTESKSLVAEPLAVIGGLAGAFNHTLTLAYIPSDDHRIEIKMHLGNQDLLVASAKVNVGAFRFASTFDLIPTRSGYAIGTYHHCCSNQKCGQICSDCNGPFFTCSLIQCTIDCDQPF
jgi:hypothetical protein